MGCVSGEKNNCCGSIRFTKRHCYDILLMAMVFNIVVGLIALYQYMGHDNRWIMEPVRREKVLAIAVLLFLSAVSLCWFIMVSLMRKRNEQQKWQSERQYILIDRPPSYDSIVSEQPPPAYITVVKSYHIV